MTEPGKDRDRTGGAGQESIGGGDQPGKRFETPSGGAIEHQGKGPVPKSDPTAQADGDDGDPRSGGTGPSSGERMGKGKTQKGPTGEGQIGNAQTTEGGERNRKSQPPGRK